MEKRVDITEKESNELEKIFIRYTSYCNILGYLAKYGSLNTDIFDKKWEEAVILDQQLSKMQDELDKKYHPTENAEYYNFFEVDFMNKQMVYRHET